MADNDNGKRKWSHLIIWKLTSISYSSKNMRTTSESILPYYQNGMWPKYVRIHRHVCAYFEYRMHTSKSRWMQRVVLVLFAYTLLCVLWIRIYFCHILLFTYLESICEWERTGTYRPKWKAKIKNYLCLNAWTICLDYYLKVKMIKTDIITSLKKRWFQRIKKILMSIWCFMF